MKVLEMLSHSKMFLLATATAIALPAFANAATILYESDLAANSNYTFAGIVRPTDRLEFRFNVLEDLTIPTFAVSATGTNAAEDIMDIRFGLVEPLTGLFTTIESIGTVAAGLAFFGGGSFDAGSVFSFIFEDGISNDVGVTLSFATISQVPLPAAGLLLGSLLAMGGLAGWRRRVSGMIAA